MISEKSICPEGLEQSELVEYLEGAAAPESALKLEKHLEHCPACTAALQRLKIVLRALERAPDAFHPSAEELYWFALNGTDPHNLLADHIESCASCNHETSALKEILSHKDLPEATLPDALQRIFDGSGEPERSGWGNRLFSCFFEFTRSLRLMPFLAVGTAAAALLMAVVVVPMWRSEHIADIRSSADQRIAVTDRSDSAPGADVLSDPREKEVSKQNSTEERLEAPLPAAPAFLRQEKDSPDKAPAGESTPARSSADSLKKTKLRQEAPHLGMKPDHSVSEKAHSARVPAAVRFSEQIEVRVTDPSGSPINWLNRSFRQAEGSGLLRDTESAVTEGKGKREYAPDSVKFVNVIVSERESLFDLDVQLVEQTGGSKKMLNILKAQGISRDDLPAKIDELVKRAVSSIRR